MDLFSSSENTHAPKADEESAGAPADAVVRRSAPPSIASLFEEEPDLPPTWSEGSDVFHTTGKCNRLQAIRRNRRITGKPGVRMRQCFNCEDIVRTKRSS